MHLLMLFFWLLWFPNGWFRTVRNLICGILEGLRKCFLGIKFSQNIRALKMVAKGILREFVSDMNSSDDLANRRETVASKSNAAKIVG